MAFYTDDSPGLKIPPVSAQWPETSRMYICRFNERGDLGKLLTLPVRCGCAAGGGYRHEPRLHPVRDCAAHHWQGEACCCCIWNQPGWQLVLHARVEGHLLLSLFSCICHCSNCMVYAHRYVQTRLCQEPTSILQSISSLCSGKGSTGYAFGKAVLRACVPSRKCRHCAKIAHVIRTEVIASCLAYVYALKRVLTSML
jgi:hypothetical protein